MSGNGWGPPLIDTFGMISGLGKAFTSAFDRAEQRRYANETPELMQRLLEAQMGVNPATNGPATLGNLGQPATAPVTAGPSAPSFAAGSPNTRAMTMPPSPELAASIKKHATAAGFDPVDVATAMSYETGGTFDPWQAGPTTKWGQHRGLIQWGEPQRRQYGVTANTSVDDQVAAAVRYLQDRGVKPGMGLLDIYSAINAGRVGLYGARDAAAGGAPGTVADKVANQMGGHRRRAQALLGIGPADTPAPGAQPAGFSIPGGGSAAQPAPTAAPRGMDPRMATLLPQLFANPYTREIAQQLYAQQTRAQEPKTATVAPGSTLVDERTGRVIFAAPAERNPMTVAPGATVYDPRQNRPLYTAPKTPEAPVTRQIKQPDGSEVAVQWDPETRQWVPLPAPQGGAAVRGSPKMTEQQSKDLVFYERGAGSLATIDRHEKAMTSAMQNAASLLPGGNALLSSEFQKGQQAGREYLAAILRKDTGAAITQQEMDIYGAMLLPRFGDGPEVLAQKREARRRALEAIRKGLGTAEVLASAMPQSAPQSGASFDARFGAGMPDPPNPTAPPPGNYRFNPQTGRLEPQ